jgi:hypothetical protein
MAPLPLLITTEAHRSLHPSRSLLSTAASASTVPMSAAIRLSNGEFGYGSGRGRRLTLWAWQSGANQMTPPRTFFSCGSVTRGSGICCGGCGSGSRCSHWPFGQLGGLDGDESVRDIGALIATHEFVRGFHLGLGGNASRMRSLKSFENLREHGWLFAAMCRSLAVFVLVLGVANDAAGLFDVIVDHRHDGVIRDPALARTIIVQHVAGPKPALLHALPRKQTQITIQIRCRRVIGHLLVERPSESG